MTDKIPMGRTAKLEEVRNGLATALSVPLQVGCDFYCWFSWLGLKIFFSSASVNHWWLQKIE